MEIPTTSIPQLSRHRHQTSPVSVSRQMFQELSLPDSSMDSNTLAAKWSASCPAIVASSSDCAPPPQSMELDDKVAVIRRRMVQRLRRRLERLPQQEQQHQNVDTQKAAQALEQYLYRRSSIQDYEDWPIVQERLRSFLTIRLCQRSLQHAKKRGRTTTTISSSSSSALSTKSENVSAAISTSSKQLPRTQILTDILGQEYEETESLVHAIEKVRLQQVVSLKGCRQRSSIEVCSLVSTNCRSDFEGQFPAAVKNLFFKTALVQAFQMTPMDKLRSLPWKGMIREARRNLQAFEAYNRNGNERS